jgi:hypothetical protein
MTKNVRVRTITTFEKNSCELVEVSHDLFYGHDLMNYHVWYRDEEGEYQPGKQGLALRVEKYPDLLRAVLAMGEHLKQVELLSIADCNAVQGLLGQYSGCWGAPPNEPPPDPPARPPKRRPQRTVIGA